MPSVRVCLERLTESGAHVGLGRGLGFACDSGGEEGIRFRKEQASHRACGRGPYTQLLEAIKGRWRESD